VGNSPAANEKFRLKAATGHQLEYQHDDEEDLHEDEGHDDDHHDDENAQDVDEETVERFEREARSQARLRHQQLPDKRGVQCCQQLRGSGRRRQHRDFDREGLARASQGDVKSQMLDYIAARKKDIDDTRKSLNDKPNRAEALKYYRKVAEHYRLNIHQYEKVDRIGGEELVHHGEDLESDETPSRKKFQPKGEPELTSPSLSPGLWDAATRPVPPME